MTDKIEVIIDGVDVSECEHLQYKGCNFAQCLIKMASFDLKCEGYNCYYKQLKRKEQECEELKQWKEDAENLFKTQTDNADKIINRYKQALDEIEKFMIYEFSGQNQWVKKNVLDIINKTKKGN